MRSPLDLFAPAARKPAFGALSALALGLMAALNIIGLPLQTAAAPLGIVSFEFAGTLDHARAMLAGWGAAGQVDAALSLGLDYLFMPAYAGALALGCALAAGTHTWLPGGPTLAARIGGWLAWAQLVAAGFDAVENFALIRTLLGSANAAWPGLAAACAALKFALVALGLLYSLVFGALRLVRK